MTQGRPPGPPTEGTPTDPERQVEEIAERFLDQLLAGEEPDRRATVAAYPEVEEPLRRRLALVEMLYRTRPQ